MLTMFPTPMKKLFSSLLMPVTKMVTRQPILEALKKHHAPATFFVVGNFLSSNPELVKQMLTEGHTVGNHTWSHPNMSKISTREAFSKELSQVEDLYREITGQEMAPYYRPPQGIYSQSNLQMAKDLGYETFFLEPCLRGLVSG